MAPSPLEGLGGGEGRVCTLPLTPMFMGKALRRPWKGSSKTSHGRLQTNKTCGQRTQWAQGGPHAPRARRRVAAGRGGGGAGPRTRSPRAARPGRFRGTSSASAGRASALTLRQPRSRDPRAPQPRREREGPRLFLEAQQKPPRADE